MKGAGKGGGKKGNKRQRKCIGSQQTRLQNERVEQCSATNTKMTFFSLHFSKSTPTITPQPRINPQNTPKPQFNLTPSHPHPTITPKVSIHSSPNYRLNADNILANALICALCTFLTPSVVSPSSFPCPVRSVVLVDISLRFVGDVDFCGTLLVGRSRSEIVSNF